MRPVIARVSTRRADTGPGIELRFEFPTTGQTVFLPMPDRSPLQAVRRKAGDYLHGSVHQLTDLDNSTTDAAAALRKLLRDGRELAMLLVQDDEHRLRQLQQAFRTAWPTWRAASWSADQHDIPVVELLCRDEIFPIELMPFFGVGSPPAMDNDADLADAAARLLGFSAVVHRVLPNAMAGDHVLRNVPALPVQFLRHSKLVSADQERRFLALYGDHVRVEGPWPDNQEEETVRDRLVRALYDGSALDGSPPGDPPVQIHHFACHCDTVDRDDDDYLLRLSTRRGTPRTVAFGELRRAYLDLVFDGDPADRERAVILLNACASSRIDPETAQSFPRWFLNRGHRAFIGTEAAVPDAVAGAFAGALYGRLLQARRPLGDALVLARRDLLSDHHNPLGLLYVLYGDAALTVEQARPGVYRAARDANVGGPTRARVWSALRRRAG